MVPIIVIEIIPELFSQPLSLGVLVVIMADGGVGWGWEVRERSGVGKKEGREGSRDGKGGGGGR